MTKPIDQERFNAAVMNWIIEAGVFLYHDVAKNEGGKKIISDATQQCWNAYGQCWNAYGRDTTIIPPKPEPEKKNVPTLNSKLSSAEICRANGWVAGDILTAHIDAVQGSTRVLITAVGEKILLARAYSADNAAVGEEHVFLLQYRDWNRELPEGTQPPAAPVVEKTENCDTSAAPVATGDTTREPALWAVENGYGAFAVQLFACEDNARNEAERLNTERPRSDYVVVPLYRDPPPPTLTDAEREALDNAAQWLVAIQSADDPRAGECADTLRGLLARHGGGA